MEFRYDSKGRLEKRINAHGIETNDEYGNMVSGSIDVPPYSSWRDFQEL